MSDDTENPVEPSSVAKDRARSGKGNLMTFLLLLLAIVGGGAIAASAHRKRVANEIFVEPITSSLTIMPNGDHVLKYRGKTISARPSFEFGNLRVVASRKSTSGGSSSGSIHLRTDAKRTSNLSVGGRSVRIKCVGDKATIQFDGTIIEITGAEATIAGQKFDLAGPKQVVVMESPNRIAETREVP